MMVIGDMKWLRPVYNFFGHVAVRVCSHTRVHTQHVDIAYIYVYMFSLVSGPFIVDICIYVYVCPSIHTAIILKGCGKLESIPDVTG